MGNTIKFLVNEKIKPKADVYPDMHTIERCEDFHLHWRNLRMIFTTDEFVIFCSAISSAWAEWLTRGKTEPEENRSLPEYLFSSYIPPIHGRRPTDFMIEVQGDLPHMPKNMIHIHYKSLRLDVSHKEFIEIADLFAKAKEEFLKWRESNGQS